MKRDEKKDDGRGRIRKQSPRSCDPCCVAEANEDVTLIITPPFSRSDILLNSDNKSPGKIRLTADDSHINQNRKI